MQQPSTYSHANPLAWIGAALFLGLAIAALVAFGILGIGRGGDISDIGYDMAWLFVAGNTWLDATHPYTLSQLGPHPITQQPLISGFAYPPTIAPLTMLLGLFSWQGAQITMAVLNLLALTVIACNAAWLLRQPLTPGAEEQRRWVGLIVAGIVVGNPFTAHVVWMGQTSLLAAAPLLLGWTLAYKGRPVSGGILLGLATIKPQISLLVFVFLLFDRQWRTLIAAGVSALILMLWPIVVSGPIDLIPQWLESVNEYKTARQNTAGFRHLIGVQSLFAAVGVSLPTLLPLAVVLAIAMAVKRRWLALDDPLALLLGAAFLLVYAHDYDLAAVVAPMAVAFWLHLKHRPFAGAVAAILMLVLFFPQRFLRPIDMPILWHYRVPALAALTLWLAVLALRHRPAPPEEAPVTQ